MASGETLLQWIATDTTPWKDVSGPAAQIQWRNEHPSWAFADDTDEAVNFTGIMPQNYAGTTGITIYIHFCMATATSGDVVLGARIERLDASQNVNSDSFSSINLSAATTVPATAGLVAIVSIAFTDGADMDSVVAGDLFRLQVFRDADNASDTATGNLALLGVEMRET